MSQNPQCRAGEVAQWLKRMPDRVCMSRTHIIADWAWWLAFNFSLGRDRQGIPIAGWLVRLAVGLWASYGFDWQALPRWIRWKNRGWLSVSTLDFYMYVYTHVPIDTHTTHMKITVTKNIGEIDCGRPLTLSSGLHVHSFRHRCIHSQTCAHHTHLHTHSYLR